MLIIIIIIAVTSLLTLILFLFYVFKDGTISHVLDVNDKRVTIDDQSLSRGLFTVAKANKWMVQVSKPCRYGDGVFMVHIPGVYSLRVPVSVVSYDSLVLKVKSHQRLNHDETNADINTFHRLGNAAASFEQADLHLYVKLSDNTLYDVTNSAMTSFRMTTNDVNMKVKLIDKRLVIDRMTSYGQVKVHGIFKNRTSPMVTLDIVNTFVVAKEILTVALPGLVNDTLLGVAGKTSQAVVTMVMDDASVIRVSDFDVYSGLVAFSCGSCSDASVDVRGVVSLIQDSWSTERLTARNSHVTTDYQWTDFYCNVQPRVAGVDIGYRTGVAIPSYSQPIPVYINTTGFTLLAYNFTITNNDPTLLLFKSINNNVPYDVTDGDVTFSDVIDGVASDPNGYVTSMLFMGHGASPGMRLLAVESSLVVDNNLQSYPDSGEKCREFPVLLGDVDKCGSFDIYDAAVTMLCATTNRCGEYSVSAISQYQFVKQTIVQCVR